MNGDGSLVLYLPILWRGFWPSNITLPSLSLWMCILIFTILSHKARYMLLSNVVNIEQPTNRDSGIFSDFVLSTISFFLFGFQCVINSILCWIGVRGKVLTATWVFIFLNCYIFSAFFFIPKIFVFSF